MASLIGMHTKRSMQEKTNMVVFSGPLQIKKAVSKTAKFIGILGNERVHKIG